METLYPRNTKASRQKYLINRYLKSYQTDPSGTMLYPRSNTQRLQNLPTQHQGTKEAWWILRWTFENRTNQTIQITLCYSIFFVKKKDSSLWPVQNYWQLNEMTIRNKYPLLLISELIDKVWGAQYFTKLNIHWRYNNVQIREGD